jgi:hypothetical protein
MKQETSAEDFFEAIKDIGAGSLYYLSKKAGSETEFIFEPVIIDTKNKDLTIRVLKRVMMEPNFIAFPGTPEAYEFLRTDVVDSTKKS